ncbi:hypothetical protein F4678DRAFT_461502 [Xylaria arbuscula]|nr:hypothetical protein F4678DRAFT_461502 [Xylaria arbuscula]
MTPLYLCASSTSTSTTSSAPVSDSTTRRPSNVIMHPPTQPPKPKKKKSHSTDPFLRDFTLVAEAARRAQMSLMTRDMENAAVVITLFIFPTIGIAVYSAGVWAASFISHFYTRDKTSPSKPIHDVIVVDDLPILAERNTFSSEYWREQCLKLLGMHTAWWETPIWN